jgi:hypothetical protein
MSGYFSQKLLIGIANGLAVLGAAILLSFILTNRREISLIPEFINTHTFLVSGLVIATVLILSLYKLKEIFGFWESSAGNPSAKISFGVLILTVVLGLGTAVYFILNLLLEKHRTAARANLALLPIFFAAAYAGSLYFDTALPLNAPNKLCDQMAYLFIAAFFLYEARIPLGRAKWRGYIAFGFTAALISAYSSIPTIIYYIAEENMVSDSVYESILTLALFIYVLVRTLMTGELLIDKISPKVALIIEASQDRSLEIKEFAFVKTEKEESDEVENQIALSELADIDTTEEDLKKRADEEAKKEELIRKIEKISTQEDG